MALATVPDNRIIPKKEHDLYKSIAKHYESKQYKRGIKAADTVLKKFPNHGETQCMKALCLNSMGKKEEAFDLVKVGLRNDMRSHVCWHVHGLLHRTEKDYPMAVRAYKQALKIDPTNMLIMRDNSLLQVQIRDYEGFAETRRQILVLKPQSKINWLSFAVGQHLAGLPKVAISIIDQYIATLEGQERVRDLEEAELMLYKADLLIEIGDLKGAAKHLDDNKEFIIDKYACIAKRAELHLLLGEFEAARSAWRMLLLTYSTENYGTHRGWQCALLELDVSTVKKVMSLKALDLTHTVLGSAMTSTQRSCLKSAYVELAAERPRSRAIRRIPLTFLDGTEFEDSMRAYVTKMVHDGVPALGADLSSFYTALDDSKSITGDMGTSHPQSMSSGTGLMVRSKDTNVISQHPVFKFVFKVATEIYEQCLVDDTNLNPTTLLWSMFLLSQLEEAKGNYQASIELINRCIEHTPTAVDMYERRGRLLRKSGDMQGASDQMEIARKLDLADRYINNKSAKYLLRTGQRQQALDTVGLFTKHESSVEHNLIDMQVMWFENECGHAALRSGDLGSALKKFTAVEKHFIDFIDDQFDFHGYCLRRVTLRSYTSLLTMSGTMQHHLSYQRAACGAVACYLKLHDDPSLKNPKVAAAEQEVDMSKMTSAEKKKAKMLARKAKSKQESEAKAKAASEPEDKEDEKKKNCKFPDPPAPAADPDPLGHLLLEKCDPLKDAHKFVTALNKFAPDAISTHVCAFDVACRRQKPLQALQALCRGKKLDTKSPRMLSRTAAFLLGVEASGVGQSASKKFDLICPDNASTETKALITCAKAIAESCGSLEKYALDALQAELADLVDSSSPTDWITSLAPVGVSSLPVAIGIARAALLMSHLPSANAKKMQTIAANVILEGGVERQGVKCEVCEEASSVLLEAQVSDVTQWKDLCAKKYPISAAFGTVVRPVMGVHEPATSETDETN